MEGDKKMETGGVTVKQKKRENPFLSLGFNIILPSIIMDIMDILGATNGGG
jgi:hypothetical protein